MKCFLEAIREQKLPTDLLDVLDEAGVRYYEGALTSSGCGWTGLTLLAGCLIVEVHDHRSAPQPPALTRPGLSLSFQLNHPRDAPPASKAEVYRIVLCPNPATLWTEIGLMDRKWQGEKEEEDAVGLTEEEAVEIEAMILVRSAAGVAWVRELTCGLPRLELRHHFVSRLRFRLPDSPTRCCELRLCVHPSARGRPTSPKETRTRRERKLIVGSERSTSG